MSQTNNDSRETALKIISDMEPHLLALEELLRKKDCDLRFGEMNAMIQRISQIRPLYYTHLVSDGSSQKSNKCKKCDKSYDDCLIHARGY